MQPTLIIGDVHGCFDELKELLEKCQYVKTKHRLIFIGDIINKGPKSLEVLRYVRNGKHEVILGNHEKRFIEDFHSGNFSSESLNHLAEQMGEELNAWVTWLESLPWYIDDENFLVVHAGLAPNIPIANQKFEILAHIRTWDGEGKNLNNEKDPPWHDLYHSKKLVVYGHWAKQGLMVKANSIGLDSGCVYGRELSALLLPEKEIIQVRAKKQYAAIAPQRSSK